MHAYDDETRTWWKSGPWPRRSEDVEAKACGGRGMARRGSTSNKARHKSTQSAQQRTASSIIEAHPYACNCMQFHACWTEIAAFLAKAFAYTPKTKQNKKRQTQGASQVPVLSLAVACGHRTLLSHALSLWHAMASAMISAPLQRAPSYPRTLTPPCLCPPLRPPRPSSALLGPPRPGMLRTSVSVTATYSARQESFKNACSGPTPG